MTEKTNINDGEWHSLHDIVSSPEFRQYMDRVAELNISMENAFNYYHKLVAIRKYYLQNELEIIQHKDTWHSSYPIDWPSFMTPIEFRAWGSIRSKGRVVLYPQYPALNYHLDFGNPGLKIGLELDGKKFHDKERDAERDSKLKAIGWTIYRISGSEMMKEDYKEWFEINEMEFEDDKIEALREWILHSGDGVIEAIKLIHFTGFKDSEDYMYNKYISYCHETLENHRLV